MTTQQFYDEDAIEQARIEEEDARTWEAGYEALLEEQAQREAEAAYEAWLAATTSDDAVASIRPRGGSDDDRPVIRVNPDLADVVDAAVAALAAKARRLGVFQRGHRLTHVTAVTPAEAAASPVVSVSPSGEKRRELVAGTPVIHPMEIATLRETLTRVARFEKFDARAKQNQQWKHCLPSDAIVTAVAARKKWLGISTIIGVAEAPFVRPDGTVCETRGFDLATGFLYAPSARFPRVPDRPTQEDARKAYAEIEEVYADFPFASEAHRAIPIAANMTILARPCIDGPCPGFGLDGNVRGAGKSLVTDAGATIVSGRGMPRKTFPRSEEELEKALGCYALEGTAAFAFDNVNREFGGGCLDAALTSREVQFRILGRSQQPTLPWRAVMFFTGNNMQLFGDVADRVLMARLESPDENPRRRPASAFRHPDLLAWLREQRSRLVVAHLTILRAYFIAGCPDTGCERWGSFEAWSRLIPHAIRFAGGPDVMTARIVDEASVNPELGHLAALVNLWPDLIAGLNACALKRWEKEVEDATKEKDSKDKRPLPPRPEDRSSLTCKQAIEALYDVEATSPALAPLREAVEGLCCPGKRSGDVRPTTSALSGAMRRYLGRVVGGACIRNFTDPHTKVAGWWVEPAAGGAGVAGGVGLSPPKLSLLNGAAAGDSSRRSAGKTSATLATPAGRQAAE